MCCRKLDQTQDEQASLQRHLKDAPGSPTQAPTCAHAPSSDAHVSYKMTAPAQHRRTRLRELAQRPVACHLHPNQAPQLCEQQQQQQRQHDVQKPPEHHEHYSHNRHHYHGKTTHSNAPAFRQYHVMLCVTNSRDSVPLSAAASSSDNWRGGWHIMLTMHGSAGSGEAHVLQSAVDLHGCAA